MYFKVLILLSQRFPILIPMPHLNPSPTTLAPVTLLPVIIVIRITIWLNDNFSIYHYRYVGFDLFITIITYSKVLHKHRLFGERTNVELSKWKLLWVYLPVSMQWRVLSPSQQHRVSSRHDMDNQKHDLWRYYLVCFTNVVYTHLRF